MDTMKSFKKYISEGVINEDENTFYVHVANGKVEVCDIRSASPCFAFGSNVVNAIMQGDIIVTTTKDGKTQTWKINRSSKSVSGPYTSR